MTAAHKIELAGEQTSPAVPLAVPPGLPARALWKDFFALRAIASKVQEAAQLRGATPVAQVLHLLAAFGVEVRRDGTKVSSTTETRYSPGFIRTGQPLVLWIHPDLEEGSDQWFYAMARGLGWQVEELLECDDESTIRDYAAYELGVHILVRDTEAVYDAIRVEHAEACRRHHVSEEECDSCDRWFDAADQAVQRAAEGQVVPARMIGELVGWTEESVWRELRRRRHTAWLPTTNERLAADMAGQLLDLVAERSAPIAWTSADTWSVVDEVLAGLEADAGERRLWKAVELLRTFGGEGAGLEIADPKSLPRHGFLAEVSDRGDIVLRCAEKRDPAGAITWGVGLSVLDWVGAGDVPRGVAVDFDRVKHALEVGSCLLLPPWYLDELVPDVEAWLGGPERKDRFDVIMELLQGPLKEAIQEHRLGLQIEHAFLAIVVWIERRTGAPWAGAETEGGAS